jgi:16S rRNA (cytosine1402-N4)-methyltransferase
VNLQMTLNYHTPVLLEEVKKALDIQLGGLYIDCTVGTGGHSLAILEAISPGGQLLGLDADPEALTIARERLKAYQGSVILVNKNFTHLEEVCNEYKFQPVNGILFDLGLSSLQLDEAERGFSFRSDGPLDMRFSPLQKITAADIVNKASQAELARIIAEYGEDYRSQQIARGIIQERPISSTRQLAEIIEHITGSTGGRIHPATKTFQSLRIAVNEELKSLEEVLKQTMNLLGHDGRLVVISYHSLEDRIVKNFMRRESRNCICPPYVINCVCGHIASFEIINKEIITPSIDEIERNPRSRSAKLRIARRIYHEN